MKNVKPSITPTSYDSNSAWQAAKRMVFISSLYWKNHPIGITTYCISTGLVTWISYLSNIIIKYLDHSINKTEGQKSNWNIMYKT